MFKSITMRKVFKRGAARKLFAVLSLSLMVFTAALAVTGTAWAEEPTATEAPWEVGLGILMDSLTGPVAFAISLIAIVAAGAALIFGGDMTGFMRTAIYIVLVIGLIISASGILEVFYAEDSVLLPLIL